MIIINKRPSINTQQALKFAQCIFLIFTLCIIPLKVNAADIDKLLNMSLSELLNVGVNGVTLTDTDKRKTPSTVTTISKQDIHNSGTRSLNQLLEMMVPNLQMIFHPAKARHLGLRGVNGTRDDKYLLVVDGRVMNEHTDVGVMSERDLPLFGDIKQIDIIRGPGSALYGPGALAMVISITTESAKSFPGISINQRIGTGEEFYSSELKYGHTFSNGGELFIYGGFAYYPGAKQESAPLYYGAITTKNNTIYGPSEAVTSDVKKYNAAFGNTPKVKLQVSYKNGSMESGIRYSQGGEYIDLAKSNEINTLFGQGYRQGLSFWRYEQSVSTDISIKYDLYYSRIDVISEPEVFQITDPETSGRFNNYREDKYFGKVTGNWHINDKQQLALGAAWSHVKYGLSPFDNDQPIKMYRISGEMPEWSTDMQSLLAEHQWNINDSWTTFISTRLDKHTFTENMFSPRATVIYTPTVDDTVKLMASRSVRTNTGADMKNESIKGRNISEVETLEALELRYEHQYDDYLWFGSSLFLHSQDLIGWGRTLTNGDGAPMLLGHLDSWGGEFEGTYRKNKLKLDFSHSYTKMLSFDMTAGVISVEESASPMGYGDDLANWFNHTSKLRMSYPVGNNWSLNSALTVYWYNEGGEDYAHWRRMTDETTFDLNQTIAFEPSYLLSFGGEYKYSRKLGVRIDSYNVLGWLDEEYNTSRYGYNNSRPGMYRVRPEALAVKMTYQF